MYLPKNKYSEPKHTPGGEFSLSGNEYVGWYIKTYRNEFYTGKTFSSDSKLLIKLVNETNVLDNNLNDPFIFTSIQVSPTAKDITNGKWTRYFLQDPRNNKIIEVDKTKYLLFKKKTYIVRATLVWATKGPAQNLIINGYPYYGAAHQNKQATEKLEGTIKGITAFIKNYSEFVE